MNPITRILARNNIIELGLPYFILDAFDANPLPYNLGSQFRPPDEILTLSPEEFEIYPAGRITPLWMGYGYQVTAYCHSDDRLGFFRFDLEDGEVVEPTRLNWQQVLVKEFDFLWEMDIAEHSMKEIAKLLQFNSCDRLLEERAELELNSFEQRNKWYLTYLEQLA